MISLGPLQTPLQEAAPLLDERLQGAHKAKGVTPLNVGHRAWSLGI